MNKNNKKPPQDIMFSVHPVTSSSTTIPRKSRWTLTNEDHPNILWWMKALKNDYLNKKNFIEIYDDSKGDVFNWLQDLIANPKSHKPLVLTHYDNAGEVIASLKFSDLKITEHSTDYDYGTSSVLLHKITVTYQKLERQNT
jgi:hypothetical protein